MYRHVLIYNPEGDFLGYGIKADEAIKLQTQNIWTEDERPDLQNQLNLLNGNTVIRLHWPDARDPDVLALLADPNFHPVEETPTQIIDEENSYLVYHGDPEADADLNSVDIDEEASVIVYKTVMLPNPAHQALRVKQAQEQIARQRAGNVV